MKAMWRLFCGDLRHHGGRMLLVGVGLAAATALFLLLCALGFGLRDGLLAQWGQQLPGHMVEVRPKAVQVGPLQVNLGGLLGEGALENGLVQDLAQLPHVEAAFPVYDVPVPMAASGGTSLFGKNLSTQIFVSALPRQLVGPVFAQDPEGALPVVLHESLVALYNTTVAQNLGTPKITSDALVGLSFTLVVGQSPLFEKAHGASLQKTVAFRAQVVGTSPYALPLGISVPQDWGAKLYGAQQGSQGTDLPLRAILIRPDGAAALQSIDQEVQAMGLHIDDRAQKLAEMLQALVAVLVVVGGLTLCLCSVAMVYAFGAYVASRTRELTLLRIVGARRRFVAGLMAAEAAFLGAASGLVGLGLARLVITLVQFWGGAVLRRVPLLPDPLWVLPTRLMVTGVLLAVVVSLTAALAPIVRAALMPLTDPTHAD